MYLEHGEPNMHNVLRPLSKAMSIPTPALRDLIQQSLRILISDVPPTKQTSFENDPILLRRDLFGVLSSRQLEAARLRVLHWDNSRIAESMGMNESSVRRLLGEVRERLTTAASRKSKNVLLSRRMHWEGVDGRTICGRLIAEGHHRLTTDREKLSCVRCYRGTGSRSK